MTDTYIPQTSASDRYEAARKALADYERDGDGKPWLYDTERDDSAALALALRALINPPGVSESEADITYRLYPQVLAEASRTQSGDPGVGPAVSIALRLAVRAGIQSAHNSWECEDRPTQEQMLRWLGIEYHECSNDAGNPALHVYSQYIDREEI